MPRLRYKGQLAGRVVDALAVLARAEVSLRTVGSSTDPSAEFAVGSERERAALGNRRSRRIGEHDFEKSTRQCDPNRGT